MGFGGSVRNKTTFPIKIKEINPLGSRGMEYITTLITPWGFSEIKKDELENFKNIENKLVLPFKEYEIGIFFEFSGDYVVNPEAYEISFSVLGINLKKVIIIMSINI